MTRREVPQLRIHRIMNALFEGLINHHRRSQQVRQAQPGADDLQAQMVFLIDHRRQ